MKNQQDSTVSLWSETGSIIRNARISDWIRIAPDGAIEVRSGKVELGTGVRTALSQIVAEELNVSTDRIRMVMGDTARTPDEGYTAGSKTVQFGGFGLRLAAAAAYQAMLTAASAHLGVETVKLATSHGKVFLRSDPSRSVSYEEMASSIAPDTRISTNCPVRDPASYDVVGTSIARADLPQKLTGQSSFVHDIRIPGMLHGRVIRPPAPGAHLLSIDKNSAGKAALVRVGNFLGVVAELEEEAVRAAQTVKAKWDEIRPFPEMGALFDELSSIPSHEQIVLSRGDVVEVPGRESLSAVYYHPHQAHASIGPSCAVADYTDGALTVWSSTQGVFPLRDALADLLNLAVDKVRVIHVEGAGCYGQNGADDVTADAALLSRETGKPVRVQWSRKDEFAWEPYGPAMMIRMRGAVDDKGRVSSWEHEVWSPSHLYRPRVAGDLLAAQIAEATPSPPRTFFGGGDRNSATNYLFPNERAVMHWLDHSPLRVSSLRSLGATANTFANECFMDELADSAGADPVDFRLAHLGDPRAREVVQRAAERANWEADLPDGEAKGIAFSRYENDAAYVATVAHIRVDRTAGSIRVIRLTAAHDCGLIINPDGLKNQIQGNLIQGTSRALKEEVLWEPSHIASVDWTGYPIITFSEVPDIDIVLINRPRDRALGAGEPATITVAPAIANAFFAATGARLRRAPFTPERVRAAFSGHES